MNLFKSVDFRSPSVIALLLVNIGFMIAAIVMEWKVFDMVLIFWVENLVIGFWNIPKIAMASKPTEVREDTDNNLPPGCGKFVFVPFFMIHFFGFCLVHGIFIFVLFGERGMGRSAVWEKASSLDPTILWLAILGMFVSHGVSFFVNFIGKKEFERVSPTRQMMSPYKRIVLVHLVVMLGGFVLKSIGGSVIILAVFFLLKTLIDLRQHWKEHQSNEPVIES